MKKIENTHEYIFENILNNIKRDAECLIWGGGVHRNRPITFCKKQRMDVRKFLFEKYFGEINDDKLSVFSSCNNNLCVNPKHFILKNKTEYASEIAKKKQRWLFTALNVGRQKINLLNQKISTWFAANV